MKIAVVGFGYWGEILVKSLLHQKGLVDYLCTVDIDQSKRKKANKYNLDFFEEIDKVFPIVNALIIATPEHTHFKIARDCLLENKHVLVEKPLSLTLKHARELVDIANGNNLTLMVDNTFLFDESFLLLKKKINRSEIGRLLRIDSYRFSPNILRPLDSVVVDLLPHDLALFYSLLKRQPGKIEASCQALVNTYCDNAHVILHFGSMVTHSLISWTNPVARREMVFYGSKRALVWQKKDLSTDEILAFEYGKDTKLKLKEKLEIGSKDKTLERVLAEFFQSIKLKKEPKASGRSTLPQIEVLEKVLQKI